MTPDCLTEAMDIVRQFQEKHPRKRLALNPETGGMELVDADSEEELRGEIEMIKARLSILERADEQPHPPSPEAQPPRRKAEE